MLHILQRVEVRLGMVILTPNNPGGFLTDEIIQDAVLSSAPLGPVQFWTPMRRPGYYASDPLWVTLAPGENLAEYNSREMVGMLQEREAVILSPGVGPAWSVMGVMTDQEVKERLAAPPRRTWQCPDCAVNGSDERCEGGCGYCYGCCEC